MRPLLFLAFLVLSLSSFAKEATLLLAPPNGPVTAGDQATIWLFCVNDTSVSVSQNFEQSLLARLSWSSGSVDLRLSLADEGIAKAPIAPGGFVKLKYVFAVPKDAFGKASLAVDTFSPLALSIGEAVAAQKILRGEGPAKEETPVEQTSKRTAAVVEDEPVFGRFLNSRVSAYEPIFFIIGTAPSVEFQFSLKARLIDKPDWGYFANHLFFGYTQTSFWDLLTADPYFYDTSYKPSFFYYKPDVRIPNVTGNTTHLAMQSGYEHESNGRGGTSERSLNTLYFQPTLTLGQLEDWHVTFQPRISYYLSVGEYNRDLAAYKGYVSLRTLLTNGRFQLSSRVTLGDRGDHASGLLDLTFRLPQKWGWGTAFQLEAFRGYDQNLLDYDRIDNGLRAGLNLWYPRFDGKPAEK